MRSVNTDVAYEYIRKKILSGEYTPGKALLAEALAKEIKVSRTPVRDALRKLETDGLVTIRAHLGASVKQMPLSEFREMSELRLALESHAAGLAAVNRTAGDLSEIKYSLEAMRRLSEQLNASKAECTTLFGDLVTEDVRFHIAIMTAAKTELMKKEILRLHLINRALMAKPVPGLPPVPKENADARRLVVLAKHDEIFSAIERSNATEAKRAMESHLKEMIDHTIAAMVGVDTGVVARKLTPEELAYNS